MSVSLKIFQSTLLPLPLYSGEVSHHMHDSGETDDYSSVCHTANKTCPSICQSCQLSVCHTTMTSPCICPSHHFSVSHTNIQTSLSICPSHQLSDHHTIIMTSPSICQTYDLSVCHTVILTSLSVCQLYDSSVQQPKCDPTWHPMCQPVCLSSTPSILPSAKITCTEIPVYAIPGRTPFHSYINGFICQSIRQSIHHLITIC